MNAHPQAHIAAEIREQALSLIDRLKGTLISALGIEFEEVSREYLRASMPVDERTKQPFGLLHGGASAALAETAASIGAWLNVNPAAMAVVGLEINANHVRSAEKGRVTAEARPVHIGSSIQVWEIRIQRDDGQLVSISRCTVANVPLRKNDGA